MLKKRLLLLPDCQPPFGVGATRPDVGEKLGVLVCAPRLCGQHFVRTEVLLVKVMFWEAPVAFLLAAKGAWTLCFAEVLNGPPERKQPDL